MTGRRLRPRDVGFDLYLAGVNWLLRLPPHAMRVAVLRRLGRVTVGRGCSIERGTRLMTRGGVEIGDGCNINRDVVLDGRGGIRIGRLVNISPEVMLLTAEHDPDSPEFAGRHGPVVVSDRAWLATRAVLLPGTTLGEGCLVGAGSVVSGVFPAWSVIAGAPGRVRKQRSPEAQQALEPYRRWWH